MIFRVGGNQDRRVSPAAASAGAGGRGHAGEARAGAASQPSRELVAVSPRPARAEPQFRRAGSGAQVSAGFVTQLIASQMHLETARARRRAAPATACAAYAQSAARPAAMRAMRRLGQL